MKLSYPLRGVRHGRPGQQRGIALFVVLVFVMLSMLLALWASRTSMFSELVVGNDADYQRAFEAAQALLQDAELDIRGERADGFACVPSPDPGKERVCRADAGVAKVPLEPKDVGELLAFLETKDARCNHGLCAKRAGRQDFWNFTGSVTPPADDALGEFPLSEMAADEVGARYGTYTGADTGDLVNPILSDTTATNRGGWYWIEVLPYDESSKSAELIVGGDDTLLPLNLTPSVVYRITALAYGRKRNLANDPVTMVVLQETYAQQRRKD